MLRPNITEVSWKCIFLTIFQCYSNYFRMPYDVEKMGLDNFWGLSAFHLSSFHIWLPSAILSYILPSKFLGSKSQTIYLLLINYVEDFNVKIQDLSLFCLKWLIARFFFFLWARNYGIMNLYSNLSVLKHPMLGYLDTYLST